MPFRASKFKEIWESEDFVKQAMEIIRNAFEMTENEYQRILWIANSFAEDEEGLVAVYLYARFVAQEIEKIENEEKKMVEGKKRRSEKKSTEDTTDMEM